MCVGGMFRLASGVAQSFSAATSHVLGITGDQEVRGCAGAVTKLTATRTTRNNAVRHPASKFRVQVIEPPFPRGTVQPAVATSNRSQVVKRETEAPRIKKTRESSFRPQVRTEPG